MLGVRVFDGGVSWGEIEQVSNIVLGGWGGFRFTTSVIFSDVVLHEIWQADTLFICLLKNCIFLYISMICKIFV